MLQQVSIDRALLQQAVSLSDEKDESQTLEMALKTFIKLKNQSKIKAFRDKVWHGDLEHWD